MIRVALLVAEDPPQRGIADLLDAHRRAGHDARLVNLAQVSWDAGRAPNLPGFTADAPPDVAHSRASAMWALPVQHCLETAGLRVVNRTAGQLNGRDKWECARRLVSAGIPTLRTMFVPPGTDPDLVTHELGRDVVIKPLSGYGGDGVVRCQTDTELTVVLATAKTRGQPQIAQPYQETGGHDLRAVVIGGVCVAVVHRQAPAGEWRTNGALGATIRAADPDPLVDELAVAAAAACDLEIGGVDILITSAGLAVIEVNTNAGGLSEIHEATGVDIAAAMATHIETIAKTSPSSHCLGGDTGPNRTDRTRPGTGVTGNQWWRGLV